LSDSDVNIGVDHLNWLQEDNDRVLCRLGLIPFSDKLGGALSDTNDVVLHYNLFALLLVFSFHIGMNNGHRCKNTVRKHNSGLNILVRGALLLIFDDNGLKDDLLGGAFDYLFDSISTQGGVDAATLELFAVSNHALLPILPGLALHEVTTLVIPSRPPIILLLPFLGPRPLLPGLALTTLTHAIAALILPRLLLPRLATSSVPITLLAPGCHCPSWLDSFVS